MDIDELRELYGDKPPAMLVYFLQLYFAVDVVRYIDLKKRQLIRVKDLSNNVEIYGETGVDEIETMLKMIIQLLDYRRNCKPDTAIPPSLSL